MDEEGKWSADYAGNSFVIEDSDLETFKSDPDGFLTRRHGDEWRHSPWKPLPGRTYADSEVLFILSENKGAKTHAARWQGKQYKIKIGDEERFADDPEGYLRERQRKYNANRVTTAPEVHTFSPDELRDACDRLGITQTELSILLGYTPTTTRRWFVDPSKPTYRPPPPPVNLIIQWMLRPTKNRPIEWPRPLY